MTDLPAYRPTRCLILSIAPLAVAAAIVWDRWPDLPERWLIEASEAASSRGFGWIGDFLGRLPQQWLVAGMLAGLAVSLIYGFAQLFSVATDRWAIGPGGERMGWLSRAMIFFSGRPRALAEQLRQPAGRDYHFSFGRTTLTAPLRVGLWMFPVVGFLGTVLGISNAVSALPGAFDNEGARQEVLNGLHTAFDTTFVGLLASIFLILILHYLDEGWERNELLARRSSAVASAPSGDEAESTSASQTPAATLEFVPTERQAS